jgi:hypothetical protein
MTAIRKLLNADSATPTTRSSYYALTLTADDAGNVIWTSVSEWVGHGSKLMWEMRAPGLVNPYRTQLAWRTAGQDNVVVNERAALGNFLRTGGSALVAQQVALQWLPNVLQPVECATVDPGSPPQPLERIPRASQAHAPSKKLRMQVIRRDDFRCRICGRRPADYVDLELHVHHIRPHGMGGLTEIGNLITLCHTCHVGLDPHYEVSLLSMIPAEGGWVTPERYLRDCEEGKRLYQELSTSTLPGLTRSGDDASNNSGAGVCNFLDTDDSAGTPEHYLFQLWHNALSVIVRPVETCGAALGLR